MSSWTQLVLIRLSYALVLCRSLKSCALPPSLLFHALFLSPFQAHNPPSRYSGLHLPWFLQHVQHQNLSEPTRVGDRHTMPARSPSVGIPSKAIGLPGIMFLTLGISPLGHLGPNPYHSSPKVTNIPLDQIPTPLLWNIWCVASYKFVLRPLINSYNQDLSPCGQHCSTPLIIKIILMPLTGPDNALLCHHFSYYLKWVHANEMFTIGDTLTCSYGGLGEEISGLQPLRQVRG